MKLYLGKNIVNRFAQSIERNKVLYRGEDALLSFDTPPSIELPIGGGRVIYIWGRVYAVYKPDKTASKIDLAKGGKSVLTDAIKGLKLKEIIESLEGHFVGVLINDDGSAAVFSDLYGRNDIFYVMKDKNLIASTDLRPIIDAHPVQGYDQAALVSMFNLYGNYTPKKHTIYKGVFRLGVGEVIEFHQGAPEVKSIPFQPIVTQDYGEDQLREYSKLMHSAIDVRSSSECNWVYMSSGWDSSSILALLTKIHGASKVRAVINCNKYSQSRGIVNQYEIDRAKKISDYFSVPLEINYIDYTKKDYVDYWHEVRGSFKKDYMYNMLNHNTLKLAKHVSRQGQSSHSVFNGEISDGAHNLGFAQYATALDHPDLNFREYSDKMASYLFGPSFFSRILKGECNNDFVYNALRSRMPGYIFDDPLQMDDKQRKAKFVESFFLFSQRIPFISLSNSKLLTSKGMQEHESVMRDTYFNDFVERVTPDTLYSWMLYLYNSFHWQGVVKRFKHAADFYNIDFSMPFGDSRVQAFLSAMPETWGRGLDLNPTKYPLKWMLKNEVDYPYHLQSGPHSYLYDVDSSWDAYADILYGSIGKQFFKDTIKDYQYEKILHESHFNLDYLRKLTDDYVNDVEVTGQERTDLKNLVSLCIVGWY